MENNTKKAIQSVIGKAWEDAHFKAALVENPRNAIKSLTGLDLPADIDLVITDQTNSSKVYINIPPKPNFDNMELSDEQLEVVAGGEIFSTINIAIGPLALSALLQPTGSTSSNSGW